MLSTEPYLVTVLSFYFAPLALFNAHASCLSLRLPFILSRVMLYSLMLLLLLLFFFKLDFNY